MVSVGYGSIEGQRRRDRDTIFECFVIPPFRRWSRLLFIELVAAAGVTIIECQSNDESLASMLFEFANDISADVVLFEDYAVTQHEVVGGVVRLRRDNDRIFEHTSEPVGDYVLEADGEIVAPRAGS